MGEERLPWLDAIRGIALFGVLLVNLETLFRVSLFRHMLEFHTDPGWWNRAVDVLVVAGFEFKAFSLFSLLFGVGAAIQFERAGPVFLVRRFVALLVIGAVHLVFVWNGDILTLYGVCGLLIIPFLGLRAGWLAGLAGTVLVVNTFVSIPVPFPSTELIRADAAEALRVYGHGGLREIVAFSQRETVGLMLPLLVGVLPRTVALMLLGASVWKAGVVRDPADFRNVLGWAAVGLGLLGGAVTVLHVRSLAGGGSGRVPGFSVDLAGNIPLALAYGAVLFLVRRFPAGLVALGRMALTNYLMQSVILGLIFFGYGLGWFGRMGSGAGAVVAVGIYLAQIAASVWWLERYRFGPFEWLWRSVSYGRWQGMLRAAT